MKKNMFLILVGVAALHLVVFGSLVATGGCKNTVMDEREFVPAAKKADAPVAPAAVTDLSSSGSSVQDMPASAVAAPAAPHREMPKYEPMKPFAAPKGVSAAAPAVAGGSEYVVRPGDTLGRIAYRNHVRLSALMKANNLTAAQAKSLRVGQKLVIPGAKNANVPASAAKPSKAHKAGKSAPAAVAQEGVYVVKAGDSIPKIAKRHGISARVLQKANKLSDAATRRLKIGQKLVIPGKGSASAAAAPKVAVAAKVAPQTPAKGANNMEAVLDEAAKAPAAAPAATTAVAGSPVAGSAAPAQNVAAASTQTEDADLVDIEADTTIDAVAQKYNTTVDALRKLNPAIPADGKIKTGEIILVVKK